jgi:AraC family transcriptional regulator of adaptative response/methylated-DNA-[protein]-cysteine methyltransferase
MEQPGLEELASQIGLSPFHFHRLFHRWVGVAPKAFLQCLTASGAKALLMGGRRVLDAAVDVGLSVPDLFVDLEVASPGEIKSGGEGWTLRGGFAETPFGLVLVAMGPRGICWLSFLDEGAGKTTEWSKLQGHWPGASLVRDDELAASLIRQIFRPQHAVSSNEPLSVVVKGSAFQVKVWRALLAIPFGGLRSYGDIACRIGAPNSSRAVGNAVANNALAFLIPCHRVITSSGAVGNYRWGPIRKQAIIAWEHALHEKTGNPES